MYPTLLSLLTASANAGQRPLLLWEVRKGESVSVLMGTCHLPIPVEHALPAPHDTRLTGARVFVSELDLQAVLEPTALLQVMITPGRDLRQDVGEDSFRAYAAHLRETFPAPVLVRMQPWMLSTVLEVARWGAPGQLGLALDEALSRRAREAGVAHAYLETAEEQFALMSGLNGAAASALRLGSKDAEDTARVAVLMSRACVDADLDAVETALGEADGDALTSLLDVRNKAWHNAVFAQVEQGNAFIAVGVGHMLGPTGLLAQAEQEGYAVARLSSRRKSTKVPVPEPPSPIPPFVPAPEKAAAWNGVIAQGIGRLCVPDSPTSCFVAAGACEARMTEAAALCIDQNLAQLPPVPDEAGLTSVFTCAIGGLAMESLVTGEGADAPKCEEMRTGMLDAMTAAVQSRR